MNQEVIENASKILPTKYQTLFIAMYNVVNAQDTFNFDLEKCSHTIFYDLNQKNIKLTQINTLRQRLNILLNH